MAWQATTLTVVKLAIGMPLGVVIGRWAWTLLAEGLGAGRAPRVPVVVVGLIVPAALLLGIAIAALPARAASRTCPAMSRCGPSESSPHPPIPGSFTPLLHGLSARRLPSARRFWVAPPSVSSSHLAHRKYRCKG